MSERIKKMLQKMGYSKTAVREILKWYKTDRGDKENGNKQSKRDSN